ncbi:LacI family transcriptional regulator [Spirochaetia bacterium]|nr:LacI family transcriptional regulator [Spirochaetia bacterium]GHV86750.1 LacI family transcriptional regulator [Spirochaetia bacterium]
MKKADIQPFYRQIYNSLLGEISSEKLKNGDQVPSEKELCEKYQVSRITSKKALELLAEEGIISRFPGKGSFVTGPVKYAESKGRLVSRTIGFIIPDFSDSFGTKLVHGIEETCGALGYRLILKRSRDMIEQEESAIHDLSGPDVTGILVLPAHGEYYNSEILRLILNKKALVFVDRKMRGLAAPTVNTDNIAAAELGVEYLLRLGHRHIAFYSGPIEYTSTVEDRLNGFIKAYAKFEVIHDPAWFCYDLTSTWTYPFYAHDQVMLDVELVKKHLVAHPELSAALVTEYAMALIVKSAAEALNRRVPEDFSILCFDSPPAFVGTPPFTYLCQDEYAIGKSAVECLQGIITGADPTSITDIMIPAKLIEGASTAPPVS